MTTDRLDQWTRPMRISDELWASLDGNGVLLTVTPPDMWNGREPIDVDESIYVGYDEIPAVITFLQSLRVEQEDEPIVHKDAATGQWVLHV